MPELQEKDESEVDETSVGVIRPYLTMDLLWLRPIAEKYGEWPALLRSLTVGVSAFVVEPEAIMIIFHDEHGLRIAGLSDKQGVKSLFRISRMMVRGARATDTALHGHWKKDSWQARFAEKQGFILNGHGYHVMQ